MSDTRTSKEKVNNVQLMREQAEGLRHNAAVMRDKGMRARERQLYDSAGLLCDAADEIERLRRELRDVVIAAAQQAIRVRNRDAGTAPEPRARRPTQEERNSWCCAEDERDWWHDYALELEGHRAAQPPGDGWTAVTDRLPAFTEDQCEFVLVYSETHDWMGAQFAVMRVADFYFYDPDHPDDIGTADSKVVTHWKPLAGPTPTKEV